MYEKAHLCVRALRLGKSMHTNGSNLNEIEPISI